MVQDRAIVTTENQYKVVSIGIISVKNRVFHYQFISLQDEEVDVKCTQALLCRMYSAYKISCLNIFVHFHISYFKHSVNVAKHTQIESLATTRVILSQQQRQYCTPREECRNSSFAIT